MNSGFAFEERAGGAPEDLIQWNEPREGPVPGDRKQCIFMRRRNARRVARYNNDKSRPDYRGRVIEIQIRTSWWWVELGEQALAFYCDVRLIDKPIYNNLS
jgi:hypothetical protein